VDKGSRFELRGQHRKSEKKEGLVGGETGGEVRVVFDRERTLGGLGFDGGEDRLWRLDHAASPEAAVPEKNPVVVDEDEEGALDGLDPVAPVGRSRTVIGIG